MREPRMFDVPVEKPRAVRQIAEMVYGNPIRYKRLAADVGIPENLVRAIIEAHATKVPDKILPGKPEETQKQKARVVLFDRAKSGVS